MYPVTEGVQFTRATSTSRIGVGLRVIKIMWIRSKELSLCMIVIFLVTCVISCCGPEKKKNSITQKHQ